MSAPNQTSGYSGLSGSKIGPAKATLLCVGLIILSKVVLKPLLPTHPGYADAGPSRGDIRLPESVLPVEIAGWKTTDFSKPPEDADLTGVIAWSHSWEMRSETAAALVSFDQIGMMGWHDLTNCYKSSGWTLSESAFRQDFSRTMEEPWHSVLVNLSKPTGESARMIFSIFDGAGKPMIPPELPGAKRRLSAIDRRCMQCQVLMRCSRNPDNSELQQFLNLHLETRERFLQHWMQHIRQDGTSLPNSLSEREVRPLERPSGQDPAQGAS